MILLDTSFPVPQNVLTALQNLQAGVDNTTAFKLLAGFAAKVAQAEAYWDNRTTNRTFETIKSLLDLMCAGSRRCCYCEDSVADEIEHIYPKSLYPEFCFVWDNYLYACGPCNGPKNNQFAIFSLSHHGAFYIWWCIKIVD